MRYTRFLLILAIFGLGLNVNYSQSDSSAKKPVKKKSKQGGDLADHYKKWMDEDVTYIISDDEKATFKALSNEEERENFVEQFWARRNPDPRSGDNAFKEEHYRRIAYANENYTSGMAGWRTDRGRIYIMFGRPDQLESHPTGGAYDRPYNEGGGQTSTYPFEKWWYRHIEGVGDDIEIEFVDKSMSGEYRMAMLPEEKDALINVPNVGLTLPKKWDCRTNRIGHTSIRAHGTIPTTRTTTFGARKIRHFREWSAFSIFRSRPRSNSRT